MNMSSIRVDVVGSTASVLAFNPAEQEFITVFVLAERADQQWEILWNHEQFPVAKRRRGSRAWDSPYDFCSYASEILLSEAGSVLASA